MVSPQILVTGSPGVGKTTLIIKVLERIKEAHPGIRVGGFYTKELRRQGAREGFEVITLNGSRGLLASIHGDPSSAAMVGRYKVDVPGFEAVVLPELQVKDETQLFVVDEVGKMELFSPDFFPAVETIIKSNVPLLGSVPVKQHSLAQVEKLVKTPGLSVYTIDRKNREEAAKLIFDVFHRYFTASGF